MQGSFFNRSTGEWQRRDPLNTSPLAQQGVEVIDGVWTNRPIVQDDMGTRQGLLLPRVYFDVDADDWVQVAGAEVVAVESYQGVKIIGGEWANRSAAQGGGIPETLTITGITDPADSDPLVLVRSVEYLGFPSWDAPGDWWMFKPGAHWVLQQSGEPGYYAYVSSAASTPVGLTGWTVTSGVGQPTVEGA